MLKILPIASSFHAAEQVRGTIAGITNELENRQVPHRILVDGSETPNVLLIVTGGTEHLALGALAQMSGPAILVAHPHQNSLPASLEILSRLRQLGRPGRIVLLNQGEEGYASLGALSNLLTAFEQMQGLRLGRIGEASDWLVGSMPEPGQMEKVWGPKAIDVSLTQLNSAIQEVAAEDAEVFQGSFQNGALRICEPSNAELGMAAKVGVALRRVVREQNLAACTVRCFDLVKDMQTTGCLALSSLLDEGIVAGCEGDLPAALTMAWMQAVTGQISFMANPQDLDPSTNTLWLAHCTIARSMVKNYALRSHFESSLGVGIQGELELGPITLARIGGIDLREIFLMEGELVANGDSELRCRTQIQLRMNGDVRELLTRPLGNHLVLVRGHWAAMLREYHELFVR